MEGDPGHAREGIRTIRRSPLLITFVLIALFVGMSGEGYDRLWEAHLLENIPFPSLFDLRATTWFGIIAGLSSVLSIVVTETVHRRLDQSHERSVALFLVLCTAAQARGGVGVCLERPVLPGCSLPPGRLSLQGNRGSPAQQLARPFRRSPGSGNGDLDRRPGRCDRPDGLWPGDRLDRSVRGLRIALSVAGIALSPLVPLFIRAARVARHKPATAAFE